MSGKGDKDTRVMNRAKYRSEHERIFGMVPKQIAGTSNSLGGMHISVSPMYEFQGVRFTMHYYCGPIFINKDGSDCKRPTKSQWETFTKWSKLTEKQQRKYRI